MLCPYAGVVTHQRLTIAEAQEALSAAIGTQQDGNTAAAARADAGAPEGTGCVRSGCGAPRADEGGDFCSPCRAYLLGDTEVDPVAVAASNGGQHPFPGTSFVDRLSAGELYLWTEDNRTITGPEALAHLTGHPGPR